MIDKEKYYNDLWFYNNPTTKLINFTNHCIVVVWGHLMKIKAVFLPATLTNYVKLLYKFTCEYN